MNGNWDRLRQSMVEHQIVARGIRDERVIQAMRKVPRHLFVPRSVQALAYEDTPLAIGEGQTISQPYIVAYMTEMLEIEPIHKVLEIGTGSGYQTAILAELAGEVFTMEIRPALAEKARQVLQQLGYHTIHFRIGDGYEGWPENAPFDRMILTAAPPSVPDVLLHQLAENGILIAPVGGGVVQQLLKIVRRGEQFKKEQLIAVRFVEMIRRN